MDKKRYLKGLKMVQYALKMLFSEVSNIYLFSARNMLRKTENQQRSSDLSLGNEKVRFIVN